MRRFYLASAALMAVALAGAAPVYMTSGEFMATGMSPDGLTVVGYGTDRYSNEGRYSSAVWHPADNSLEWLTSYDASDLEKGGGFLCVSNDGVIGGYTKDPLKSTSYYDDWMEETVTTYYREGAIWRDGRLYHLGSAHLLPDELADENDGAYVRAISADGNMAVGNLVVAWMDMYPAVWTYNPLSDSYEYAMPSMPVMAKRALLSGISADGNVIVGTVNIAVDEYNNVEYPCVWHGTGNPEAILPEELTPTNGCSSIAVSPDGRYVAYTSGLSTANVYDIQTGDKREINLSGDYTSISIGAVDNLGNFVGAGMLGDGFTLRSLYYSYGNDVASSLGYLLSQLPEPYELSEGMDSAMLSGISADGNTIFGVSADGDTAYWLQADLNGVSLYPGISDLNIGSLSPQTLLLTWSADGLAQAGPLSGFNIYIDGKLTTTVAATETSYIAEGLDEGMHSFSVSAMYGDTQSAVSEPVEYFVNLDTALPFFDDFEAELVNPAIWTRGFSGIASDMIPWSIISGNDYENMTGVLQNVAITSKPFSSHISSRWLDATDESSLCLSAYIKLNLLNSADQDLSDDYLDFEYTTDGLEWHLLHSLPAASATLGEWFFIDTDISSLVAGKLFKIRMHAHGNGKAQLRWMTDLVKIGLEPEQPAIEGMIARAGDNTEGVRVAWPSIYGTLQAGHVINSNLLTDYNIGNEGRPFIAAISLGAADLEAFDGMYMRGVSAFIYDNPAIQSAPTSAEVMVWDNGELVSRNTVDTRFDNPRQTMLPLTTPVLIDATHEYKVGVSLVSHDALQTPVYYQASRTDCVPGVTDLYSEDGGQTWRRVSEDLNNEVSRWCVWPIRADITPEADSELPAADLQLLGYNLFRVEADGSESSVNSSLIYAGHPWWTDADADENASYRVRAYYLNGDISVLSEPVAVTRAAVESIAAEAAPLEVTVKGGFLTVAGADGAVIELYDAAGRLVRISSHPVISISGLPRGIYMLRAGNASAKTVIR